MGEYTVSSSGADCKSVALSSGGATPSSPTKYTSIIQLVECPSDTRVVEGSTPSACTRGSTRSSLLIFG